MVAIVNGRPLTSFPLYLDKERKVYVLDLPPRLVDENVGLYLEAYHGMVRIRQNPDENVEIEIFVTEDGFSLRVWGVVEEEYTINALVIHSENKDFEKELSR